jgi:YVTN family beta-propeller protein
VIARTEIGIGSEFVGYRIDELLGRGGMGVVYRAFDLRLKRTVALKLMAPELSQDAAFRERFSHEAELAISLEHPNVVPIHDAGDIDGRLYIAMRYVDGTDFGIRSRARGRRRLVVAALGAATVTAIAAAILLGRGDATPTVVPDSLVKIDLESDKIVDIFPVGRLPREIEIVGRYVFEASEGDGTLTRVDTHTDAVVSSGKFDASDGLAAAGAKRVWVASVRRRQVTLVDAVLPIVDLPTQPAPRVPLPRDTASRVPLPRDTTTTSLTVGGGALWIAIETGGGGVVERWRLDPLGLQRTYRLGRYDYPEEVAFGYGAAWIALGAPADALLRIDARSGRTSRIPVGGFPVGVAVGFGSVWVVQREDDTVRRIDPVTGRTLRAIAVGHLPAGVAVGEESVLVTSRCAGTVSRVDPAANRVVGTIEVGYHPLGIAVDGDFAWVGVGKNPYFATCP